MRQLRTRASKTPEAVASAIDVTRPTVQRMETGYSLPGPPTFAAILDQYAPSDSDRAKAMQLYAYAKEDDAVVDHAFGLDLAYRAFRQDERDAIKEQNYQPFVTPGITQLDGYVAALRGDMVAEVAGAAEERRVRRDQLRPPRSFPLEVVLHEAALLNPVGGPAVMVEQLEYLLELAELPNVDIRVRAFADGPFVLMHTSAVILSFDDAGVGLSRSVYLESPAGGRTLEDVETVQVLADEFELAKRGALPPAASMERIRQQIEVYRRGA
ncbi:helix-turn-helix domain-containing protein [Actinokineospora enzanensis]|uniref:helix-turn-helix domain-containing protein n=1 Tax=Actinokineospora enzanensis TaxID=155975 RepID=UPI000380CF8E|nr:helix-turn-helix transcriptional regulator [Actinokineospora enzanensis]